MSRRKWCAIIDCVKFAEPAIDEAAEQRAGDLMSMGKDQDRVTDGPNAENLQDETASSAEGSSNLETQEGIAEQDTGVSRARQCREDAGEVSEFGTMADTGEFVDSSDPPIEASQRERGSQEETLVGESAEDLSGVTWVKDEESLFRPGTDNLGVPRAQQDSEVVASSQEQTIPGDSEVDRSADVRFMEDNDNTVQQKDSEADRKSAGDRRTGRRVKARASSSGSWVDEDEYAASSSETRIGRFFIEKKLGEGTFGMVYLARDRQLERDVAIKVAKVGVLNERADVDRFLREAKSAAQLRHPNIVPVYEVGTYQRSNYIAYQFIEGKTLSGYLKEKKKLPPLEAAIMARKLASALDYAHSYGIIHRDMKPDNVLLDRDCEPHIADFGLARMDGDVTKTRDGLLMGTPLYMSPEQASGHGNTADGRSDVWSMGVIIEEMLTGLRPFRGNLTQILTAIQTEEPAALRRIDESLPRDLETIVQKCLRKKVDERYQSARELADELDRFIRGEPILARPIGLVERAYRWSRRNPLIAGLAGTVIVTMFVGTVVSTALWLVAKRNAELAIEAGHERSVAQLEMLQTAVPESLEAILKDLQNVKDDIRNVVRTELVSPETGANELKRLRLAAVILYPDDERSSEILNELSGDLLETDGSELVAMSALLERQSAGLVSGLWQRLNSGSLDDEHRFRALCVLARTAPKSVDWQKHADHVVSGLMQMNVLEIKEWLPALSPVKVQLRDAIEKRFQETETVSLRRHASIIAGELYGDQPEWLLGLAGTAAPEQLPALSSALRSHQSVIRPKIRARLDELLADRDSKTAMPESVAMEAGTLGILAMETGNVEEGIRVLRTTSDRAARTEMIQLAVESGISPGTVLGAIKQLQATGSDAGILAGLVQILGMFPYTVLNEEQVTSARTMLEVLFRSHSDSGVHGNCEWVLRRWGYGEVVEANRNELQSADPVESRNWHIDPVGVTFLVVRGPVSFRMGVPENDPYQFTDPTTMDYERPHQRYLPRSYGIAQTEVTVGEYLQFQADHTYSQEYTVSPNGPVIQVTWWDAAKYCRWLSEKAGVSEEQMCYPPIEKIGPGMEFPENLLDRTGYRLPTAAEWEYAARAGAMTRRPFGTSNKYVSRYCRFNLNSEQHAWPEFDLPPNDWGLFAMQGNVLEWSQDWYFNDYPVEQTTTVEGVASPVLVDGADDRIGFSKELRGGDLTSVIDVIRVSDRDEELPDLDSYVIGFRLARTYRGPATDAGSR